MSAPGNQIGNTDSGEGQVSLLEQELLDPASLEDISRYEFSSAREKRAHRALEFARLITRILKHNRLVLAAGLTFVAMTTIYLYRSGYLEPGPIVQFLSAHPFTAPVVFALLYALMVAVLLPTLPFNLAAGLLWGPVWGSLISVVAASTGSAIAFLVSRHLAADFFRRRFRRKPWRWLRRELRTSNWKVVAFTRINPVFPFGPLNYFFGLTGIRFGTYLATTAAFLLPPSFLFASLGSSLGGVMLDGDANALVRDILIASAAVAVIVGLRYVTRTHIRRRRRRDRQFPQARKSL